MVAHLRERLVDPHATFVVVRQVTASTWGVVGPSGHELIADASQLSVAPVEQVYRAAPAPGA